MEIFKNTFLFKLFRADKILFAVIAFYILAVLYYVSRQREEFPFFLYGMYAAATDGISKAWISNISDRKYTATAIGTYTGFQSVCTLIASSLAGFIWYRLGAVAVQAQQVRVWG